MTSTSIRRIGAVGSPGHAPNEGSAAPVASNKAPARRSGPAHTPVERSHSNAKPGSGPGIGSFLRAPDTAARDVMRVCNQIKRMASLVVTAAESGHQIEAVLARAEELTETVLDVLGYDSTDTQRLDSVRPMIMESVCSLMADSAKAGEDPLNQESPLASALISVAKSRGMARAIDRAWPTGVEEAAAVRVAAVNALTPVTIEALDFDFFHAHGELMKESAAILYEVVQQTVVSYTPEAATDASKMVLTQSLLQSGGRVMASVWRTVADEMIEDLNSLNDVVRRARIDTIKTMTPKQVLNPVKEKFAQVFAEMVVASDQILDKKGALSNKVVRNVDARQTTTGSSLPASQIENSNSGAVKPQTNQRVMLRRPGGSGPR